MTSTNADSDSVNVSEEGMPLISAEEDAEGEVCGPTVCEPGLVCCNESCGECTRPGQPCITIGCVDIPSSTTENTTGSSVTRGAGDIFD